MLHPSGSIWLFHSLIRLTSKRYRAAKAVGEVLNMRLAQMRIVSAHESGRDIEDTNGFSLIIDMVLSIAHSNRISGRELIEVSDSNPIRYSDVESMTGTTQLSLSPKYDFHLVVCPSFTLASNVLMHSPNLTNFLHTPAYQCPSQTPSDSLNPP